MSPVVFLFGLQLVLRGLLAANTHPIGHWVGDVCHVGCGTSVSMTLVKRYQRSMILHHVAVAACSVPQLRSLEDHLPMPGITVGDIGPKFGFGGVDNGYMSMDHVRIRKQFIWRVVTGCAAWQAVTCAAAILVPQYLHANFVCRM